MVNEPNLAEWITAWSAVAGVVVSLVLIFLTAAAALFARAAAQSSADLVRIERDRDDRQELRHRRAQAELVAAWREGTAGWTGEGDDRVPVGTGTLYIRNASSAPVWDVLVQMTEPSDNPLLLDQPSHQHQVDVLPPGKVLELPLWESGLWEPYEPRDGMHIMSPWSVLGVKPLLSFRDAANVTWTRTMDGVLEERGFRFDQASGRHR